MCKETSGNADAWTPPWPSKLNQWLHQMIRHPSYPFLPLVAGAAFPAGALVLRSHRADPTIPVSVRLVATLRAVHALSIGTASNMFVCSLVGGVFYLAGVRSAADFKHMMDSNRGEIRTAFKPERPHN